MLCFPVHLGCIILEWACGYSCPIPLCPSHCLPIAALTPTCRPPSGSPGLARKLLGCAPHHAAAEAKPDLIASLYTVRENNWPPLPFWCPVKPCFYQDFSVEIPADYQRICKMLYYLWMCESWPRPRSSGGGGGEMRCTPEPCLLQLLLPADSSLPQCWAGGGGVGGPSARTIGSS